MLNVRIIILSAEQIYKSKNSEGNKISFYIMKCLRFLHTVSQMRKLRINFKSEDNYDIYYIEH